MLKHRLLLAVGLLAIGAITACSGGDSTPTATPAPPTRTPPPTVAPRPSGAASEYRIEVFVNARPFSTLGITDVSRLPQTSIDDSDVEKGPTLLSVLKAAGIERFRKVQVVGLSPGRKSSAERTLAKDEVTDRVILDITNRGTTKLASPDIPPAEWVLDVSRIYVEQGKTEEPVAEYTIEVLYKGEKKASLTLDDIKGLPQAILAVQGTQEGPTLLSVLDLAGVKDFSSVTVKGLAPNRARDAELVLDKQELTEEIILDITGKGTTKLASTLFPREKWIIDVSSIEVD